MRRAIPLSLLLALPACGAEPCPSEPLAPIAAPRWVVRFNESLPATGVMMILGMETLADPPGTDTYAAFAIYDEAGAVLNERWIDTDTSWDGRTASVNAATTMPSRLGPGELTLLLPGGTRPSVTFDLATGEVTRQLSTYGAPPEAGGQLGDMADLGDGTALLTRRRGTGGVGGDVLLVDVAGDRGLLEAFSLAPLSRGAVEPLWIAALAGPSGPATRAIVGLSLLDEDGAGAIAVIDVARAVVTRLDIPGLASCAGVVPLEPDRATARAAVLCTGDLALPAADRDGAGVVLLEAPADGPVRLATTRPARSLFSGQPPTGNLVALAGDWIAFVSRGDPGAASPDALIAVHLTSDAGQLLHEEHWTEGLGRALGQGDYSGELWWPSVRFGLLRWSMTGSDSGASFSALSAASPVGCSRLSPRVVRAVGATPPVTPRDAGVPDAGPLDAGAPPDAGAATDAGADAR